MSIRHIVEIEKGPQASGPYSLGVLAEGKFLFVAGQGPYDPENDTWERGTIAEQTEYTLKNVERVVKAAGGSLSDVVSCRVFLQPLNQETFDEMNAVYEKFFSGKKPARTTVGSTLLGIDVEIDCIVKIS